MTSPAIRILIKKAFYHGKIGAASGEGVNRFPGVLGNIKTCQIHEQQNNNAAEVIPFIMPQIGHQGKFFVRGYIHYFFFLLTIHRMARIVILL